MGGRATDCGSSFYLVFTWFLLGLHTVCDFIFVPTICCPSPFPPPPRVFQIKLLLGVYMVCIPFATSLLGPTICCVPPKCFQCVFYLGFSWFAPRSQLSCLLSHNLLRTHSFSSSSGSNVFFTRFLICLHAVCNFLACSHNLLRGHLSGSNVCFY